VREVHQHQHRRVEKRRVREVTTPRRQRRCGAVEVEECDGAAAPAVEVERQVAVVEVKNQRPLPPLPEEESMEAEAGAEEMHAGPSPSTRAFGTRGVGGRDGHGVCEYGIYDASVSAVQYPSAPQAYARPKTGRICPGDSEVEATIDGAPRRTLPKDAQLPFAFGQRPPARLRLDGEYALPLPLRRIPEMETETDLETRRQRHGHGHSRTPTRISHLDRPLPPLPISTAAPPQRYGPRQPPWGSLDGLSVQREKRHDVREREQAWVFRALREKRERQEEEEEGWRRVGAAAAVDGIEAVAMKAEVEGYRAQIVRVYPDMVFDGSAGKGGRACCCAVM
jgi:hypothetical protein